METKINIIEWSKIDEISLDIAERIIKDNYNPDIIISIVRGGMVPSVILSHKLNIRDIENIVIKETIDDSINAQKITPQIQENKYLNRITNKKVLIVDDIVGSGNTLKKLNKEIKKYNPREIKSAIYFVNKLNWNKANDIQCSEIIEYIGEELEGWVIFPWENKHKGD